MQKSRDGHRPALEVLEARWFMSAAPLLASVGAGGAGMATPFKSGATIAARRVSASAPTLTLADRQQLLKNWIGPNAAQLQADLAANDTTAFDNHLLAYMRGRTNRQYYFEGSDAAGIVNFINNDGGLVKQKGTKIAKADKIVAHLFPELVNSETYTIQLGSTVDWINQPSTSKNTEFRYSLNRHFYWNDLAMAYRFTGDAKYVNELKAQLESWSKQYTTLRDPDTWISTDVRPKWDLFTTAERIKNWLYAYQMVKDTGGWNGYSNTLFLHRLLLQGDFMSRTTKLYEPTSNKATGYGTALYSLGLMMPEFKAGAAWQAQGQTAMFKAMDVQFRADGGHYEQSPGYQGGAMAAFFDTFRLASINGLPWGSKPTRKLRTMIDAFYQLLTPDGKQAALSDTYRSQGTTFFTRAAVEFNDPRWPRSRPRLDDVWQLGTAASAPLLTADSTAALAGRGGTAYMPYSGYYVTRTGDDKDARQLTFDAGPKGGDHGHLDLLNFELFGYKKPLIADPGLMSYSATYSTARSYAVSTPAHNTISIDGLSHASSEKSTIARLTHWSRKTGGVQMAATQYAYTGFKGAPVVARNIWHDRGNVFLVVDFGAASANHTYTQSFNLFTNNTTKFANGVIRTKTGTGDVMLQPLLTRGQTTTAGNVTLSNTAPPAGSTTGLRFAINQTGRSAVFATLMVAHTGTAQPNVSAKWLRMPTARRAGQIEVTNNGVKTVIYFAYPDLSLPSAKRAVATTSAGASRSAAFAALPPAKASSPFAAKTSIHHDLEDLLATPAD